MTKSTADILRGAAARVRRGWYQGDAFDPTNDENGCAVAALCREGYGTDYGWLAVEYLRRTINQPCLVEWNGAPGQTAENVATTMEFAALLWDQEQIGKEEFATVAVEGK